MVTRVLGLIYREVRGLHQAAYVLALFALASQILALVRDRLLAHQFGAGSELDVYYTAFRIPDLLYVLFASVLSVYVLLPFVSRAKLVSDEAGKAVLAQMFTLFLVFYSVVSLFTLIAAPYIVPVLFGGFSPEANAEIVLLLRILLLQPLLLGISSLFGVVTQIHHRFVLYALSPLLYNIGIIIGATLFFSWFGIAGLALGVVVGALGHMLVQWPLVRQTDLAFGTTFKFDWSLLGNIAKVAVPRAFTLSLGQLQLLAFVSIASAMAVGSVSVLQFGFNLQSVPLAIVGMSYSVAAFPVLAELLAKEEKAKFLSYVSTAMRHIIFWSLPIIALVIVLRAQIVRVLLGSGSFNWEDTRLTAAVLAIFVVSLAGQAIILLLVRAFYAGGLTRVPLIVTAIGSFVGVVLAVLLTRLFVSSPAFATEISSWLRLEDVDGAAVLMLPLGFVCGVIIEMFLILYLFKKYFGFKLATLWSAAYQSVVAAVAGGSLAYLTLVFIVEGVNQETFLGIFIQGLAAGVLGIIAIIVTYAALGSHELREITKSFKKKVFTTDVVAPEPDIL